MTEQNNKLTAIDMAKYFERLHLPILGVVELTSHCNLNCSHCLRLSTRSTKRILSKDFVLDIVKQVFDTGCMFLTLTGGEPCSHPEFLEIYDEAYEIGVRMSLTSNGTLISSRIARLLKDKPPISVNISLYGLNERSAERVTRNPDAFRLLEEGLIQLSKHSVPFRFLALVTADNAHPVHEYEAYAARWNAPIQFFTCISAGLGTNIAPLKHRLEPSEAAVYLLANAKKRIRTLAAIEASSIRQDISGQFNCGCGLATFFIDSDARLRPCQLHDWDAPSLHDFTFKELWHSMLEELPRHLCESKESIDAGMCPAFVRLQGAHFDSQYYQEYRKYSESEIKLDFDVSEPEEVAVQLMETQGIAVSDLYECMTSCGCRKVNDQPYNL
ncbi:MAG: radical SAM protein [Promethearchaeota archaeon]